jgi:pSer/pThr/pTyr-binding forkhead associated (FHA) protein
VVEDQYSANGTFVNGARISDPHPLCPGDELRIGATVFVARAPEPSPESGTSEVPSQIAEPVVEPAASQPGARLAVRLELDREIAEMTIDVEDGATVRIVRDGDGWRVDAS